MPTVGKPAGAPRKNSAFERLTEDATRNELTPGEYLADMLNRDGYQDTATEFGITRSNLPYLMGQAGVHIEEVAVCPGEVLVITSPTRIDREV